MAALIVLATSCTWHRQLPPLSDDERRAYANDEGFSLVRESMTTEDVIALLGPPTSQDSNPSIYRYRGRGYVVFAPARLFDLPRVIQFQVDPDERGS